MIPALYVLSLVVSFMAGFFTRDHEAKREILDAKIRAYADGRRDQLRGAKP